MNTDSIHALISKVNNAERNIKKLKDLKEAHRINKSQVASPSLIFSVSGRERDSAYCFDEGVFFNAIEISIESQEEAIRKDKETLEAMELLLSK